MWRERDKAENERRRKKEEGDNSSAGTQESISSASADERIGEHKQKP